VRCPFHILPLRDLAFTFNNFGRSIKTGQIRSQPTPHILPLSPSCSRHATSKQASRRCKVADIPLGEVPPLYGGHVAALSLNTIVVGAGVGGLTAAHSLAHAGHRVMILKAARDMGEVGVGMQTLPNAIQLLLRWGLGPALRAHGVGPTAIIFRWYDMGERVGYTC